MIHFLKGFNSPILNETLVELQKNMIKIVKQKSDTQSLTVLSYNIMRSDFVATTLLFLIKIKLLDQHKSA